MARTAPPLLDRRLIHGSGRLFASGWTQQMAIDSGAEEGGAPGARLLLRDPLRRIAIGIAILTLLRFALGIFLPLSFDEAYYWLWSKHLAASYYDHPPAIAYAIRFGTMLLGDTPIGVRLVPLLLSVAASWSVWRAGRILLDDERSAALACLYFNLTLMVAAETM